MFNRDKEVLNIFAKELEGRTRILMFNRFGTISEVPISDDILIIGSNIKRIKYLIDLIKIGFKGRYIEIDFEILSFKEYRRKINKEKSDNIVRIVYIDRQNALLRYDSCIGFKTVILFKMPEFREIESWSNMTKEEKESWGNLLIDDISARLFSTFNKNDFILLDINGNRSVRSLYMKEEVLIGEKNKKLDKLNQLKEVREV